MSLEAKVTEFFLDRAAVQQAVGKSRVRTLGKASSIIRKDAIASIHFKPLPKRPRWSRNPRKSYAQRLDYSKARRLAYSKPDSPPHIHRTTYPNLRAIIYAFNPDTQGMVIGPIVRRRRETRDPAPKQHEHGGQTTFPMTTFGPGGTRVKKIVTANYPKRAIMGPAFERKKSQMAQCMAGTLTK